MRMQNINVKTGATVRRVLLSATLLTVLLVGFGCGSGSPATTPAITTSQATTMSTQPTTPTASTATSAPVNTTKPPTTPTAATTPKTSTTATKPAGDNPSHLTVDIEQIETDGFKILWLRPLNDVGSIMIVEGKVDAKLWLIKDGGDVLINEWKEVPFGPDNYTLISKGAEIALIYPNEEVHDYDEPANLEVNLVLKNGTKLSARLEKISLHPTAIT